MRLGRTTAVYFGSQVVISLSGFVATFAIARLLGAAVLGQYAVVVALLFWITIPVNAISSAINKRISEERIPVRTSARERSSAPSSSDRCSCSWWCSAIRSTTTSARR
ncbi:hypothetical protein [Halalkalicoccus salilacus]|uniref:hypothetical protein n=1 Tax=Halalkalicoccus sp. GCM10025704 TaxID=3252662 RepID=UPI003614A45A